MATWKSIPGYGKHYQISREGVIRINPRSPRLRKAPELMKHRKGYSLLRAGDLVRQHVRSGGYLFTNLRKEDGRNHSISVHRLLMLTFKPTRKPNRQVNHKDGNKLNNCLSNLEWVTHRENLAHAWEFGLRKKPDRAILTATQVSEIRQRYVKGRRPTLRDLGGEYGVTHHAIYRIVKYKNWKHV